MTRMLMGDHVEQRNKPYRSGVIVSVPERDVYAGRCCYVRWNDGGEQLCITRDLRRTYAHVDIVVEKITSYFEGLKHGQT